MTEFKVIERGMDLTGVQMRKMPWDVVLSDGTELDVYDIPGYVHTEGGRWGKNSFYACPRGEVPSAENLMMFDSEATCRWGFTVEEESRVIDSDGGIVDYVKVTILRNGKAFKRDVYHDIGYGIACAMKFLVDVREGGAVNVDYVDWEKSLVGKKIWYENTPAIVERVVKDFEMLIVPESGVFEKPASWTDWTNKEWESDYGKMMRVPIDSDKVSWFRRE